MGRRKPFRTYPDLETFFRVSGVSQTEFARRIGKTQSYVSKIKTGMQEPSLADALVIAETAGVPLESLIAKQPQDVAV